MRVIPSSGPLRSRAAGWRRGQATLLTGLRGVYAANVRLMDGLNVISFRTEDPVGNLATAAVTVERVHELVTGADARQIELIARGAASIGVSDDGSAFVFDSKQTDVIEEDTNGEGDVFAWRNGVVTRVSHQLCRRTTRRWRVTQTGH